MSTYLKVGAICGKCGSERVEISHTTLQQLLEFLKPAIYSIPQHILVKGKDSYAICPRCDSYALGREMQHGSPFINKLGETRTIHDFEDIWEVPLSRYKS